MFDGIRYGRYLDIDPWRVSVDGLRLKFEYKTNSYNFSRRETYPTIDEVSRRLDSLFYGSTPGVDIEWSIRDYFKIGGYCRTCTIKGGNDWSCAVLIGRYCYDSACKLVAPEAVLDVNPNKVPGDILRLLVGLLSGGSVRREVKRYDVAYDIPLPRSAVKLVQSQKSGYRLFRQNGAVTEYQGERGHDGALKVYDKTKEDDLAADVTRVEITYDGGTSSHAEHFPRLLRAGELQSGMDLREMPFAVQACWHHPDLVDILKDSVSSNTFRKYMDMLEGMEGVSLSPAPWKIVDDFISSALLEYTQI